MDYEDMDKNSVKTISTQQSWRSPHNPCGRVWERQELKAMGKFTGQMTVLYL